MSDIQSKIIRQANKQENTIQNEEKNNSIETKPEMTQISRQGYSKSYYNNVLYVQENRGKHGHVK